LPHGLGSEKEAMGLIRLDLPAQQMRFIKEVACQKTMTAAFDQILKPFLRGGQGRLSNLPTVQVGP